MSSKRPGIAKAICLLCRRKFPTQAALKKHEQISEMHKENLEEKKRKVLERKTFLRHSLRQKRHQLNDANSVSNHVDTVYGGITAKQRIHDLQSEVDSFETEIAKLQEELEKDKKKYQDDDQRYENPDGTIAPEVRVLPGVNRGPSLTLTAQVTTWWGNKDFQEDRYILAENIDVPGIDSGVIYGVFDGHNGPKCADFVIAHLGQNLASCLSNKALPHTDDSISRALVEAFILTDSDFLKLAFQEKMLDGSTAVVCFAYVDPVEKKHKLAIAHCGDSRAIITRKTGVEELSLDHKPDRLDEQERIRLAGGVVQQISGVWRVFTPAPVAFAGRVSQWGLAVARSFGDLPLKDPSQLLTVLPDVKIIELTSEDMYLILACDGIFDVLSNEEVAECAKTTVNISADKLALDVTRLSYARGSEDNLTTVAIKLEWGAEEASAKRARHDE